MNHDKDHRVLFFTTGGQNWLQRIVVFLLAATTAVLAFFFLTIVLAAGTMLAAIIAVRWWWLARKLHFSPEQGTFEGEYVVIEHSRHERPGTPRRPGSETNSSIKPPT